MDALIPAYSPPALRLPVWMTTPLDLRAPLKGAEEISRHQRLILFAELVGRPAQDITQDELDTLEAEFQSNKTVLAIAQANGWRHVGELRVLMDRILQVMAGQAEVSALYAYHPDKYESVAQGLRAQLAELEENHPGGSRWNDLDFITNEFVPMCAAANKNGYEMLWQPGTISKTRLLADYLRTPLRAAGVDKQSVADATTGEIPMVIPAQLETRLDAMLADTINPRISVREFKKTHGEAGHPPAAPLAAFHFNQTQGGATLIFWKTESQRIHLEQVINARFRFGTRAEIERLTTGIPPLAPRHVSKPQRHRSKGRTPVHKVSKKV